MLVLTPPILRLDAAAFARHEAIARASFAWDDYDRNAAIFQQHEPKARATLVAAKSSMMDRMLRRTPEISHQDVLAEVRRLAGNPDVQTPEIHLAVLRQKHPVMAEVDAAEARRLGSEGLVIPIIAALRHVAAVTAAIGSATTARDAAADAFLVQVAAAEAALRDRRHAGFWDAVLAATGAAAQAADMDLRLRLIVAWQAAVADPQAQFDWPAVAVLARGAAEVSLRLADGSTRAVQTPPSDSQNPRGLLDRARPVLAGTGPAAAIAAVERPLAVSVDADRAGAVADAHARCAAALEAADRDPDVALVGQQYRMREAMAEHACRLEQAVGRMAGMLSFRMRENAALVSVRMAANTAAVQDAAASAAMGNARLIGAVQAAADRIDASLGRIPAGWRVG